MTRPRIIRLRQIHDAKFEQWTGRTDAGVRVYARERNGRVRIDLDGVTIIRKAGDDAYAALAEVFEIDCDAR